MKRIKYLIVILFVLVYVFLPFSNVSALQPTNLELIQYSAGAPVWGYNFDNSPSSFIFQRGFVSTGRTIWNPRLRICNTNSNSNVCNTVTRPRYSLTQVIFYTTGANYVASDGYDFIVSVNDANRVMYFAPIAVSGANSDYTFWEAWLINGSSSAYYYIDLKVDFRHTLVSDIGFGVVSYAVYQEYWWENGGSGGGSSTDYSSYLSSIQNQLNTIINNTDTVENMMITIQNTVTSIDGKLTIVNQHLLDILDKLDEIVDAQSDYREQDQQAMQDAQDAGDSASSSSSDDADATGTTLLSAFSGFVTAVTSASPTNCRIPANLGRVDLGELDFCANPVPAWISTIGSLILVVTLVPLSLHLATKMITIFRSFTNG